MTTKRFFFIYSLPRSGSAWLSQFLSQPGSFCYHEPLADSPGFIQRLEDRPEWVVGGIDTSFYKLEAQLPSAFHCYALHRPLGEIRASSERLGFRLDWGTEFSRFKERVVGLHVIYYHLLSDIKYLEDLWAEVVRTKFDRERAEYLMEMNIQRSINSVVNRLQAKL